MEYTVSQLAKISGVSGRTLRYYDEIDLLKPKRVDLNGYRIYGNLEVNLLQQILFYRELDFSLDEIKGILNSKEFEIRDALENQLSSLQEKRNHIDDLIKNVRKTIKSMEGEISMNDTEKFEAFKKELVEKNEEKYGNEIRDLYGDTQINKSNARVMGMSEKNWEKQERLSDEINEKLKRAMESGDPSSEISQEVCKLHREWLCMFWGKESYSKEAHKAMADMYVSDERLKKYYDRIGEGAAQFLKEALEIYSRK